MIDRVTESIKRLLPTMERSEIIAASLNRNGAMILVSSRDSLIRVADIIAAEHLEIFHKDSQNLVNEISNAGAFFVGPYSAEALGDYCAGPNHVLPTSGTARFSSPLGVYDFQKRSSVLQISAEGAQTIGKNAVVLAKGESLTAHAQAARLRLNK